VAEPAKKIEPIPEKFALPLEGGVPCRNVTLYESILFDSITGKSLDVSRHRLKALVYLPDQLAVFCKSERGNEFMVPVTNIVYIGLVSK
jgi:hypothetical protein